MCDPTPVRTFLALMFGAILVATALIVVAALTNTSFFLAWMSPGWMVAAAFATLGALALCTTGLAALEVFCRCAGRACAAACANLRNVFKAAEVVLGIQAAACFAA